MTVPPCRLELLKPLIYFRSYSIGQRRAGSGTHLPPPRAQQSEIYSRRCSTSPRRKAKATMNCRAPVVCLVLCTCLVLRHNSRSGRGTPPRTPPPDPPPSSTGCLLSHSTCLVLGHSSRSRARTQQPCRGGGTPPGHPPRAHPLVLGHRFCLVLGHSRRAGRGTPHPRTPPSSTPPGAGTQIYLLIFKNIFVFWCLKKKLNALRPSEHPPVRGKMSKHLGGIIGCKYKTSSWHLNGFPDGSNIGQQ